MNLSITTDDTLGVLAAVNILDYTIIVDNGAPATISKSQGGQVQFSNNGLTATATDLRFNFNANIGSNYVYFLNSAGTGYFAWQGTPVIDNFGPGEIVFTFANASPLSRQAYSGNQIVASVANNGGPGPVPEPATWAMMILGFGAAGSLLRRRRVVAA